MRTLWVSLLLLTLTALGLHAQQSERMPDVEQRLYGERLAVVGDYETMKNVHRYWVQETLRLKAMRRFDFSLTGPQECVLKVTIPCSILFVPNDTVLSPLADGALRPLLPLLVDEHALASVIVACHTDNNGASAYLQRFSAARARAVERWLRKQRVPAGEVASYGLGDRSPRARENATMAQRASNRRVTLYFVPNRRMLKAARRGNL